MIEIIGFFVLNSLIAWSYSFEYVLEFSLKDDLEKSAPAQKFFPSEQRITDLKLLSKSIFSSKSAICFIS